MTTPIVEYAQSGQRKDRTSLIALAVLGVIALVLLLIGAGFLIGVWFSLFGPGGYASRDHLEVFMIVLYVGALVFFASGGLLVWVCVRRLMGIMDR